MGIITKPYTFASGRVVDGTQINANFDALITGIGAIVVPTLESLGAVATTDARLSDARVASDVSAWAKAASKPSYSAAEVSALPAAGGTLTGALSVDGNITHLVTHGTNLKLLLSAARNGGGTGEVGLYSWISEPGATWTGGGIARNISNSLGTFPRINTGLYGQMMHFTEVGDIEFVIENTGGTRRVPLKINADGSLTGVPSGSGSSSGSNTGDQTLSGLGAVAARVRTNWNDGAVIDKVVGLLAWKNHGNNHVIFDASQSTNPDGGAISNANSQNVWQATFPTLMGYNGSQTYGVRVDSARVADSAPASDVSAWAKAASKPTYTASEVGTMKVKVGQVHSTANVDTVVTHGLGALPAFLLIYTTLGGVLLKYPAQDSTTFTIPATTAATYYNWIAIA